MARVSLARAADRDLIRIARHSVITWGREQSIAYQHNLRAAFNLIAEHPAAGSDASALRPGLRKFRRARHVIFYRHLPGEVLILRILHFRQLPTRHL